MSCREATALEALHDGRLAHAAAETLRLHLGSCQDCRREAARLERLSLKLGGLRGSEVSHLRVAAGRRRLLEAAGRVDAGRGSPFVRIVGFALAACALALVAWFGLRTAREPSAALSPSRAQNGELELIVTPGAGATWARSRSGATETLTLSGGELAIQVNRHASNQRLLVKLPDGELEDVGTVFTVEARAGKTRAVAVTSGRVALRLQGRDELMLSAGESFRAPDDAPATSAEPLESGAPRSDARAPGVATKTGSRSNAASDETPACPSASLFQAGVQAFKRGEYASAVSLLDGFSAACGRSNHAEDAAYLRMVALARAGQADAARAQAHVYLTQFPHGFRRKEAERLAGAE
jgi:hypothetical protein